MAPAKGDSPSDKFEISPRNKLYLKISGNLSEEQVKTLRLLLNNHIGKGKIENATPHDIFNMLENDHKMGGGNLALLKDLLKSLGEAQLAKEAEDLEREESMKISPTSKRKAEEDASSTKQPKINCGGGFSDDSDSSDSGTGCSSSHDSPPMETDEFDSGEHLATSAEGAADVSTFETVGDVRKRIENLGTKIAKLTRNPTSISKTKTEEVTKACQQLVYLVKVLDEQSSGELKMDITPLDIGAQNEFQEEYGSGTLSQKIQKEVKQVMRSTGGYVVNVKPEVSVEFDPGSSESTTCGPGRCAKIKVTAKAVELADGCKLDKDSAVRHLFKYLVENSRKLRPIVKYLNDLFVQVKTISYGSIDFDCLCLTPESASHLQEEYDCKRLEAEIQRVISSLALLIELGIKSISLAADLKFTDEVSLEMTSSSDSGHHFEPVGKETIERLRSRVAQLKVRTESDEQVHQRRVDQMKGMMEFQDTKPIGPRISQEDVSRFQSLHSKLGFKVDGLRPKSGGNSVHVSSIPLILANDLQYNTSTGVVGKIQGAQRTSLQVVPEALDLLEGIEGPVSVLAISGPCRTGKSYILSRLLGTSDAFELGHRTDPQTFGIWMGTKVLRGEDFTIVLLDTEGIDAVESSAGQDASILVMTILLSSYLIYNSQNVPRKGDLEKMECFVKLANGITVKKGEGRDVAAFREFFPDFLWMLRDVSQKMQDKDGKDMDPGEYLKKRVLSRDPDDFEESTSDKVGRAILTFFSSVECATLERPSWDTDVINNIAQHTGSLNPNFNKGVEELTERLLLRSRAKRGYIKGSTVSGMALSILAKQYVEAVNDPNSIPSLDNTWKNTVELMRDKAIEELVVEYNKLMKAKVSGNGQVPMEEVAEDERNKSIQPTLMDLHNEVFKEITDKLLKKVGHFGTSSEKQGADENNALVEKMQNRLVQREERTVDYVAEDGKAQQQKGFVVTGGELLKYITENRNHSKVFCQQLYERLFDPIRKHVETPPPDYDFKKLLKELDHAHQQYGEQARGPEKWTVLKEMTENQDLKARIKKIKGYQDKLMKERQKAQEAELAVMEKLREMQEVYKQAQDMQKAQEETIKKMDQQHRDQMEKLQEQEKERREREEQKHRDLLNAHMKEMAEMAKERNERESSKMAEMMLAMQQQSADENRRMVELLASNKQTPPPPPPDDEEFGRMFRVFKFW